VDEYLASNRELWDEWTEVHVGSRFYDVEGFRRGDIRIRDYEIREVGDVANKDLLHLQCHFGIDTLSWARLGARVTGADFSERAIEQARRLAEEIGVEARFVHSDLYSLPEVLDADFDIVYTSRGVIPWLPDLRRWGQVIAHFLRPGGIFYIAEGHPVMWVFDDEGEADLRVRFAYFEKPEPLRFPVVGSYADPNARVTKDVEYAWAHSIGDVVTSLAEAGLRIEFFHEHPFMEWELPFVEEREPGSWYLREDQEGEIPLSFSLKASKPDRSSVS
jgi:SAM-dependent methyltransferase